MQIWFAVATSQEAQGLVNNHRGGFNDTAVNLSASHLLGGFTSLWCSLATELKHMGNYLHWAASLDEFTHVHFPRGGGQLNLCCGDKIKRVVIYCRRPIACVWYLMWLGASWFQPCGGSDGSHSTTYSLIWCFNSMNQDMFTHNGVTVSTL